MAEPDWNILLIGGTSGVGKTSLAHELARHFDARHVDMDLFWIVLQRTLPPEVEATLHLFEPATTWLQPVEELIPRYERVAAYICKAIEPVIAHYDIIGVPAVIEGTWLLPGFAKRGVYAGRRVDGVQAIYLDEPSRDEIEHRIATKPTPWHFLQSPAIQRNHIETQYRYGLQMVLEARELGLPILESRPADTLLERALELLPRKPEPLTQRT